MRQTQRPMPVVVCIQVSSSFYTDGFKMIIEMLLNLGKPSFDTERKFEIA
jgi:hypothetical protein